MLRRENFFQVSAELQLPSPQHKKRLPTFHERLNRYEQRKQNIRWNYWVGNSAQKQAWKFWV